MMKILPSKIVDGFLSDDDILLIKNEIQSQAKIYRGEPRIMDDIELLPSGVIGAGTISRTILELHDRMYPKTKKLLREKVAITFGKEINLAHAHMLTSYIPYRIHTDGLIGEHGINDDNYGAYTFLIPLDNYDSHTIVFNEYQDNDKLLPHFMEKNEPKNTIDDETYQRYFKNEVREHMKYLSIDKIFKWKKGSCLAMSRYVFHGSDGFFGKIPLKQGLVMWTSAPNGWEPKD